MPNLAEKTKHTHTHTHTTINSKHIGDDKGRTSHAVDVNGPRNTWKVYELKLIRIVKNRNSTTGSSPAKPFRTVDDAGTTASVTAGWSTNAFAADDQSGHQNERSDSANHASRWVAPHYIWFIFTGMFGNVCRSITSDCHGWRACHPIVHSLRRHSQCVCTGMTVFRSAASALAKGAVHVAEVVFSGETMENFPNSD